MTLIQQSHDRLAQELARTEEHLLKAKDDLRKMTTLNAEMQDALNKTRKAVREARIVLGKI